MCVHFESSDLFLLDVGQRLDISVCVCVCVCVCTCSQVYFNATLLKITFLKGGFHSDAMRS